MFILFCRCRDVWVCGLYLSSCSLYMAFYVVCYFLRSEEGNASQIICSLDYNHVKSLLPSVIETCLSLNWCCVPFPFVGILGRRDQLHAWAIAPLAICSFGICEGGCDLAEFCALAQNVHSWAGSWMQECHTCSPIPVLWSFSTEHPQSLFSKSGLCWQRCLENLAYAFRVWSSLVSRSVMVNVAPLHDKYKCNCGRFWKGQTKK